MSTGDASSMLNVGTEVFMRYPNGVVGYVSLVWRRGWVWRELWESWLGLWEGI